MAILSLLCMTYVMGLLVIAKSYTFENKSLKIRVSKRPVTGRSTNAKSRPLARAQVVQALAWCSTIVLKSLIFTFP